MPRLDVLSLRRADVAFVAALAALLPVRLVAEVPL
jgi:hypothetical protein